MRNVLSSSSIKKLTAEGKKINKVCDGEGLYLWVYDTGKKVWYYRYCLNGKRRELYLGLYPQIGLAEAREKANEYAKKVYNGIDPIEENRVTKLAERVNTFEKFAMEWFNSQYSDKSASTRTNLMSQLKNNVFPFIGSRSIASITKNDVLLLIQNIEARKASIIARLVVNALSRIFQHAMILDLCDKNPAYGLNKILTPKKTEHFPAPTEPEKVGEILRKIDSYKGLPIKGIAVKILPYVFVRPNELCQMKWADIDFNACEWKYLATKTQQQHVVPLSKQVIELLTELREYTGNREFCFMFGAKTRVKSNTIRAIYRQVGLPCDEVSAHGWRATARTLLDEVLEYPPHIIEQQLAHCVKDPNGRAYNRTHHLEQRKKMMQEYADYLDSLKKA